MTLTGNNGITFQSFFFSPRLKEILILAVKLSTIYLFWRIFTIFIGAQGQPISTRPWPWLSLQWEHFNTGLTILLSYLSLLVLKLMGYNATLVGINLLRINGSGGVSIGNYCLGIELMVLFTALIISYPGPAKQKMWFIPLGLVLVQFTNVLRIVALCLLTIHAPKYAEFNHHFTFRFAIFIFILFLCNWFIQRYSPLNTNKVQ